MTELAEGAETAAEALAPDDGDGAAVLAARAERAIAPLERLAPELARAGDELRDLELRLREVGSELRGFLASLEAQPDRVEVVESELDRIAEAKRRFRAGSYEELLERAAAARAELDALADGLDPAAAARRRSRTRSSASRGSPTSFAPSGPRRATASPRPSRASSVASASATASSASSSASAHGATGLDEVAFLIRPNAGLPFGPVAETASGGELSRVALAIAAVGGGETLVFDEIDAGIGGTTAHAVAETLKRLAGRAQVITITHLPQIASVAERHYRVEKIPGDPTHTRIELLDEAQRRDELERMLGGREFLAALQ